MDKLKNLLPVKLLKQISLPKPVVPSMKTKMIQKSFIVKNILRT